MSVERTNPLAERLFQSAVAALDLYALYLGDQLGLYRALHEAGSATSTELAERTGTTERYVREWLEQQAVSGILAVDDPVGDPLARRYHVPPEHVEVLVDEDSLNYQAHKGVDLVRAARPLPALVEAFRTGAGLPPLPWPPEGRAEFNRARFLNLLGKEWLPAIPAVHDRLTADPPAKVADLGCGTGWSSIAMAQAYPKIEVDGFDLDEAAIGAAHDHAAQAGVADRVRFDVANASTMQLAGPYDLVTIFEALHDMSHPVEALAVARSLLAPGGSLVVADELVADRFDLPADEHERYAYGWSVVSCLPSAMGEPGAVGTGAVMRPATLRRYATEAGFTDVETLEVDDVEWRFYRLVP
jgi:2-polyprenyl-3-methyl-5-hydroxy-6-metoxy-1,4-benzoquinol methylase